MNANHSFPTESPLDVHPLLGRSADRYHRPFDAMKYITCFLISVVIGGVRAGHVEAIPAALCIAAADAARSAYTNQTDQIEFLRGFRYGYLETLIGETYSSSLDHDLLPYASGFRAGRQDEIQRRQHGQPFAGVWFEDFGYTQVEATGSLELGFETAKFTPRTGTNFWWIRLPDRLRRGSGRDYETLWQNGQKLFVKGWLSPEGIYGHMGMYKRELIVYQFTQDKEGTNEPNDPASGTQPARSGTNSTSPVPGSGR
jgi:hypothetical protein